MVLQSDRRGITAILGCVLFLAGAAIGPQLWVVLGGPTKSTPAPQEPPANARSLSRPPARADRVEPGPSAPESFSASLRRLRRGLSEDSIPDILAPAALWHEEVAQVHTKQHVLDGEGDWPEPVIARFRASRRAEWQRWLARDMAYPTEPGMDQTFRRGFLPAGLEVFVYEYCPCPTAKIHTAILLHDPGSGRTSPQVHALTLDVGGRMFGPSPHRALQMTDLEGDGQPELVFATHSHNGTVHDSEFVHYLEWDDGLSISPALYLRDRDWASAVSENESGYVYRRLHRIGANDLMVSVRFENPDAGVGPRRLGRVWLRRPAPGQPYEVIDRDVDSPAQEHRVAAL